MSRAIIFENGQGLRFVAQDFGAAGVKFSMQDDRDNIYAVILREKEVGQLMEFLSQTTGQPAMCLPGSSADVLRSILDRCGLDAKQERITRQIVAVLDSLVSEKTPIGKQDSEAARSLNRSTKMPCRG